MTNLNALLDSQKTQLSTRGVLTLLDELKVSYVVAGGFARDTYFGIIPKDVDIIVKSLGSILTQLISRDIDYKFYDGSDYIDSEDSNRIGSVIKIGDVDLIEMSVDAESPYDQVINYFDYNINQFIILNGIPTFVGSNFGTLERSSSEHVTEERAEHIKKKALKENWNVETP